VNAISDVRPRYKLLSAALLFLLFLTACTVPPGDAWPGLTVADNYVYVAYRDVVFRINVNDAPRGQAEGIDWAARPANNTLAYTPPALSEDGAVFVGTFSHQVFKFLPSSPQQGPVSDWVVPTTAERIVGQPVINNGLVYVPQGDQGILAYDIVAGGAPRYTFKDTEYGVWARPIVDDEAGLIYIASLDHNLYALNQADLTLNWKLDLDGPIAGTPLKLGNRLYVGTFNSELIEVDLSERQIVNRFATKDWIWGTPVHNEGILYFADLDGWIYALDLENWSLLHEQRDTENPAAIRGAMVVAGDRLIAGSENGRLRAYSLDGLSPIWTATVTTRILGDLVLIGEDVIFTTIDENQLVIAYNINTGNRSWSKAKPSQDDINRLATAVR
jgi:outer membrane protein assembly factor BamB